MKKLLSIIPAVICFAGISVWQFFSDNPNHYLMAASVIIVSLIPFFISFEKSKPSAKEISLIASLIAIAVVSRAAFYLIPQVKPIGAVVAVSGVCLGGKRGYFVGAMSAFVSDFIFGQGIWTPFQMVALGTVGLISGLVFSKIRAKRLSLSIIGFVLTFIIYGLIVDSCSVIMLSSDFSLKSALAVYAAGIPFGLVFGITTFVFLFLFGEAFVKKINRIIVKYGIIKE
ncbi:MAG: ECF transporter S component [Acetobacter sp.]|nr:ECF transporter S component [Bacteroides sp.]MCM1341499.1 ECF transporter S component [Acetobacter sp.]MCM1433713.1 ECF transporter S component [Clostridiales bacterium]